MRKVIASLDIGSSTIKMIVAEIIKNKTNVLAVAESESKGIKRGCIVNKEDFFPTLKEVIKKCEGMIGLKIRKLIVTVPAFNTEFLIGEGTTTITNEEKEIKGIDIVRAMQSSIYNRIPKEYDIVSIIPTSFHVDDEPVKNPLHMTASKLSVKTVVAMVPRNNVRPILDCLEKLGIEVIDMSLTCMGDYSAINNDKINNLVGAIINLGEETTTISIFNKGVLTNTKVLEIGGQNIDNDISFIYKVTSDGAKKLKEELGLAHNRLAATSATKLVTNKIGEKISVNQYELSEIIMSRLEEILNMCKKQINYLTKKEIHYIIVTGGVSEMPDFELVLESVFGHNAKLARVHELGVRNNKYTACLGLIKYYNNKLKLRDKEFSIFTLEEQEELGGRKRGINISDNSMLGKLFGYFFDN